MRRAQSVHALARGQQADEAKIGDAVMLQARDRRDRRNLMNRIAERPEFETSLDGQYSPRLSDYTSGYDL